MQVNEELINEFFKSTKEFADAVNFFNKVASDTISKFNQLKQEFDNNKIIQKITNIQATCFTKKRKKLNPVHPYFTVILPSSHNNTQTIKSLLILNLMIKKTL